MQRERGKKRDSSKKSKGSGGRQNRSEAGGAVWSELSGLSSLSCLVCLGQRGSGKVGRQAKKAERELSTKQERAKGKGQESRHQHRFPPLFYRAPPSRLNIVGLGAF